MNRPITGNYLAVRFWISSIETNWGESIHVLGELPELGSWRPDEGNKMSLFRVDGWMLKKKLSSVVHFMKDIEFKYARCREVSPGEFEVIEWERGTNRKIDANELIRCGRVSLESHWNKRKVRILFLEGEEENSVHYSMNLIGDIPELGSINGNFMKMKLINRKVFEKPESCWEYSFFVDVDIHHFYYSYVRFYRKKKQVVFGRMKYRQFVLQEATSETKARDMKNPIYLKYNCYIKVDDKMKTEIQVNQLDNTIFFGSYPQIQEDIDILHQRDIKHVVNLMSQREIYACLLDVPFFAKKCRISDINYLELDYDLTESVSERRERVITIAYKIHHLVMKSEPLYICEMDGFEKVQEVLSYLIKEHFPSRSYLLVQNKLLNPIEDLNLHTSSRSFEDIEF